MMREVWEISLKNRGTTPSLVSKRLLVENKEMVSKRKNGVEPKLTERKKKVRRSKEKTSVK